MRYILLLIISIVFVQTVTACGGTGQFGSCMGDCASGQYCFGSSNDCYCGPTSKAVQPNTNATQTMRHIYDYILSMRNYNCTTDTELELADALGYSLMMRCVDGKLSF